MVSTELYTSALVRHETAATMREAGRRTGDARWADAVGRYRRLEATVDPALVVHVLSLSEPEKYAPVFVWIAWHEVQAECWSSLAARDSMFAWHDQFIGGYHRAEVRRLKVR